MEEFFRQGDLERDDGLEVSAMCDRYAASVDQTQVCLVEKLFYAAQLFAVGYEVSINICMCLAHSFLS